MKRKPKTVVVDSSVIVKWLNATNEQYLENADELLRDCERGNVVLVAPELSKCEVANALLRGKRMSKEDGAVALRAFYSLPIMFVTEKLGSARRAYTIARGHDITYYDAVFIALAKTLRGTLVTDNPRHQAKFPAIRVIQLKDYSMVRKV